MKKRINKILILFIFLVVVSFVVTWEILQSNWVASKISSFTTSYAEKVLESKLEFDNLEFNFFPPGAKLRNLSFKGKKNNLSMDIKLNALAVYFNPMDALKTTFVIDKVQVDQAKVKVDITEHTQRKKKDKGKSVSPLDFFDYLKDIPVKTLELKTSKIQVNDINVYIHEVEIANKLDHLKIDGKMGHFNLDPFLKNKQYLDELNLEAKLSRNELELESLRLKSNLIRIDVKGKIKNYVSKNIRLNLDYVAGLPLRSIHDWLEFKSVGELYEGTGRLSGKLRGTLDRFFATNTVELENFKTDFLYGEKAKVSLSVSDKNIIFNDVVVTDKKQKIKLLKPFEFFNFKSKKFVEEPIVAKASQLKFNNFLTYLRKETGFMDGVLSGTIRFDLLEDSFSFKTQEDVKLDEFTIGAGDDFKVLSIKDFDVKQGVFDVINGKFQMQTLLTKGDTNLNISGEVGRDNLSFKIPLAYIEFDKIDLIANEKFGGKGTMTFNLLKEEDEIVIKTRKDFKDFSVMGYNVEKVKADVDYQLGKDTILVKKLSASSGKTRISGLVSLNYKTMNIDGNYEVKNLSFAEAKKIATPLLKDIKIESKDIQGNYNVRGKLFGKPSPEDIKLSGSIKGKNLYVFDENIDDLRFNYFLKDQKFDMKRIVLKKSKGRVHANLFYDLKGDHFKFESDIKRIALQDLTVVNNFPTTLKGNLKGYLAGELVNDQWKLDSYLKLTETIAVSKKIEDTTLKLKMDEDEIDVNLVGFGNKIKFESKVYLTSEETSFAKLDLKFDDIRDGLILISGVDLLNMDLTGSVDYSANVFFNYPKKKVIDAYLNTKRLSFKKGPVNISYYNNEPEIIIKDGRIEKWKTNIRGRNFYLISKGQGDLKGDYLSESQMKVDASVVEVFNKFVSKANGNIRGKFILGHKDDYPIYEAFLVSNNLSLSSSILPTSITKANVRVSFLKNKINIQKFNAQLVSGYLNVSGYIDMNRIIPDVNVHFQFRDAGFVVMKKSNLIISGDGDLIGKNFPYTLSGDFYIQKFALVNELTDFGFSGSNFQSSEIDFLPNQDSVIKNQILNFNINVLTREPMYIRNSLADLGFLGNLQVLGGEEDIRLAGKINLAPRNNKVTFKNNEFSFSKGNVIFTEDRNYKNPELDFFASSNINNVAVEARLLGPVDSFDFKLTSDKDLSQTDILSLIIFGYTEDLSNNLSDAERESMTRAGVGSIIFDSFKINETLKNEFGLQVNLGTEIQQEEGNLLSQRGSDNTSRRVRSATTFEVKKKINDQTSLSVLGTVSSSTTQKSSVNLNYKINQNVSVEGVYESVITDDAEAIDDDSSVGADVKWKWSFK